VKKLISAGLVAVLSCVAAVSAVAHPNHGGGQTVIANYPITTTTAGYQTQVQPVQVQAVHVPVKTYQTQYQVVPVPTPQPVRYVHVQPKPQVYVPSTVVLSDCVCARSATGKKVNVFATAGRWQGVPKAKIGGGKQLIDVRGFHQGYWRVSYYPNGIGNSIEYGWVRQADLVCKETRGQRVLPVVRPW
jgi:hypothetical protein